MATVRLIDTSEPGYTRAKKGGGWRYIGANGRAIKSKKLVDRLNAIALPPAYRDAWYSKDPTAHILATGIDDRGRKQYRYHPDYRAARDDEKYSQAVAFGSALPKIRAAVEKDLEKRTLSMERVVAAVIRLLDQGSVRVGNSEYAKANKSFGATTLRNRHAKVQNDKVRLEYVGKGGKTHRLSINDRRLARLVRQCLDLPGHQLFQYLAEDGSRCPISSSDVNDYLREHGGNFTAKNFRTWGASKIAFEELRSGTPSLKAMLAAVSDKLGNTPAIARKSYVHPALIEAMIEGRYPDQPLPRATRYLGREERGLIQFLESVT
jgi:DNA topoisomerase I